MLEAALSYASKGWKVLPLWPMRDGRCGCGNGDCPNRAKHPLPRLAPNGSHSATTDAAIIAAWWADVPDANVGIATGQESGVWVLDIDPRHGGDVTLEALEARYGRLPTSLRARTGSGGAHILFVHPRDGRLSNSSGRLGAGLDVRGDGGYIVAAPSNHASGGTYAWEDEDESILEAAPNWLLELIGERYADDLDSEPFDGDELPEDQAQLVCRRKLARACVRVRDGLSRHQTAVWLFQQLRDNRVPRAMALDLVAPLHAVANEKQADRAVPKAELVKALKWAYQKKPRQPDSNPTVQGRPLAEIAALQSDIERHRAIRETAAAEGVPVAAVRADVARLRTPTLESTDWRSLLLYRSLSDGSQVLEKCLHNAAVFLQHHPAWAGRVWENSFTAETNVSDPPIDGPAGAWADLHTAQAAAWLQSQVHLMVTPEVVDAAVGIAAHAISRHPVREYLEGLEWDGEERLDAWLEDLAGVDGTMIARAMARRFLVAAVARIFRPGCKVDHALILEGPQNLGKSTLLSILFSPWYSDEIDVLGSKDAGMQVRGVWGIEIAELASVHRTEVERVKAFMTRREDRFRPPYGRRVVAWPRQLVFVGSTNREDYLIDETGGRRFWGVRCRSIDLEGAAAVRDQLWAEAVVAFKTEEKWWFDSDELQTASSVEQEARFQVDAWEERIAEALEPFSWQNRGEITVSRVLQAIGVDVPKQDRAAQMRAAACLKRLGYYPHQRRVGGLKARFWFLAPSSTPPVGTGQLL
jgi:predicted P-loop ATPase